MERAQRNWYLTLRIFRLYIRNYHSLVIPLVLLVSSHPRKIQAIRNMESSINLQTYRVPSEWFMSWSICSKSSFCLSSCMGSYQERQEFQWNPENRLAADKIGSTSCELTTPTNHHLLSPAEMLNSRTYPSNLPIVCINQLYFQRAVLKLTLNSKRLQARQNLQTYYYDKS